jgi:hypothetical protein
LTNPIFFDKKCLTAELAEHAEVKTAKAQGQDAMGKKASSPPFPAAQYGPGAFKERSLRSPPPLRSSSCLQSPGIERQRGVHFYEVVYVFCPYPEKALRSLRTLRLIFFFLAERGDFYNFLRKNKKETR